MQLKWDDFDANFAKKSLRKVSHKCGFENFAQKPTFCSHNHFIGKIILEMGSKCSLETHNKGHDED